ncbi:hypothetical protein [Streptomyces sp. NPDC001930]|uniref:hypothetical protein n=1 Tax=Streptomyces sp. NPDC001930 TaxID=3364625 RepID=UPI003688F254
MARLAERLRAAVEQADLGALSELAGRAQVSETVASEALRAVKCPTERTLRALLQACGVSFDSSWEDLRRAAGKAWRVEQGRQRELERAAAARLAPVVVRSRSAPELTSRRRLLAGHAHVGADGDLPLVSQVRDRALLGIHPAFPLRSSRPGVVLDGELPSYVLRDTDAELRAHLRHARDHGGLVLVSGASTAGKTRAAAEAMWAELAGWSLLIPVVPQSLEHLAAARLDLTRTVIWLNELHMYLGAGRPQADAVTRLLALPDKPVLLATIRAHQLSDLEEGTGQDAHDDQRDQPSHDREVAAVRGVLSRARRVRMERMFSAGEVARAEELSSDTRLATALRSAGRYGVAEMLAAGPELLHLLQAHTDAAEGHFGGAALVHASVDVARVGWRGPVQTSLLRMLLPHYVPSGLRQEVDDALFDRELRWARRLRRGFSRLLVDDESGTGVRAFDYLVDHAQARVPQPPVPTALWTALLDVATAEEALELGHQAQRWKEGDVAVAAWRKAVSSADQGVVARAAGELGRLLMDRADAEEALPCLLQAAEAGNGSAGTLATAWYVARGRFEDALPIFRWRADGPMSGRTERRALCNWLAGLARWHELSQAVERFHAEDSTAASREALWSVRLLTRMDPEGLHTAGEEQLLTLLAWTRYSWWEHRVTDLVERLGDTSLPTPTVALVAAAEGRGEPSPSHPQADVPAPAAPSEAELLAQTTEGSDWSRFGAWHELVALLWSQGRFAEMEQRLRTAAVTDSAAAENLVRLLRITDRQEESERRRIPDGPFPRLGSLMVRGDLPSASDVAAYTGPLRHIFLELYVARGLRAQAEELADGWAREGDPSPALELYRRSRQWERVLAVLPPNASRDLLTQGPGGGDYGVEALVELGRLDEAERMARRRFEAGDAFCAQELVDVLLRQGRIDAAEALLDKIRRSGGTFHAREARDQLGRLLSSQGRHGEAIQILRDQSFLVEWNSSHRQDPVDRIALAQALAGTGAVEEALGELLAHLEKYPPYATSPVWLTVVELLTGHDRAGEVPGIVGTAAATDPGARYALAKHHLSHARHDEAVDLLLAHPHDHEHFHDSMLCTVTLAALLRDQGRTDEYRLLLWRTAHLNWLETTGDLRQQRMGEMVDAVVWAVDASGLDLPGNFHSLRGHAISDDMSLDQT